MIEVSVIIVNYNTKALTKQCIDSIFDNTKDISFEVIVVDNDSKDGSIELLSEDTRIKIIESRENLGFGKANNLGVKHSSGKYLFFLNSDTLLLNNAIKMLFDCMERNEKSLKIGALGCLLLDANHNRTHSFANFPDAGQYLIDEWRDHILKRLNKRVKRLDENVSIPSETVLFPVDYITGADLFVNSSVIDKYGGFDKDFFMYYEESEMQNRWHRLGGLQSFILKGPQIVHLEGKSLNKNFSKYLIQLHSQMLYFKKTCYLINYFAYRILFLIGRLLTLPFQNINKEQRKEYLKILLDF